MSRKARPLKDLGRSRKPKRSPYDRVLIVSEGGKTEPYYFRALVGDLKLNTANVEVDGDSDSSPRSVVSYAKKRYDEDKKLNGKDACFDRVYCVIDKDEHETYQEAINTIQTASPKNVFHATTSVPCFEFWILLHFDQTTKPFVRAGKRSPCDNLVHELKSHLPNYGKGDKTIYEQIKGKTDTAIMRAKQVNANVKASGSDNPSTSVPELIEYLRGLGKPKV
jgi:hypothetical protein